ncbi:hypothetical protein GC173_11195 [bacterium]|nr:hypothetical protein [bacterium]
MGPLLKLPILLLIAVAVLSSCSFTRRSEYFKKEDSPRHGKPLSEDIWVGMQEAREAKSDQTLSVAEAFNWPLPFNASAYLFEVDRPKDAAAPLEKAQATSFVWNDIASPMLMTTLPYRIKWRLYQYERGTDRPIGFRAITYSPFVFEDRAIGKVDERYQIRAQGLPLLFADLKIARNDSKAGTSKRLHGTTTLWTLGPAWATFGADTKVADDPTTRSSRGYVALPVALGGGLGAMLWTDYSVRLTDPQHGGKRRLIGHGPLAGVLGYFEDRVEPASAGGGKTGRHNVHVLGGLLWHHYTKRDAETGARVRDRSGPLWSMFGWGHSGDRFKVRVLFIPIG